MAGRLPAIGRQIRKFTPRVVCWSVEIEIVELKTHALVGDARHARTKGRCVLSGKCAVNTDRHGRTDGRTHIARYQHKGSARTEVMGVDLHITKRGLENLRFERNELAWVLATIIILHIHKSVPRKKIPLLLYIDSYSSKFGP